MQASAQDLNGSQQAFVSAAGTKKVRLSGALIGMAAATAGACTQGFSNQGPSGNICSCLTVMGAKFSSAKIGKGAANFFATVDMTAAFGRLGGAANAACAPLYGEIDVIAKEDSPTFDVVGGECFEPNGDAISNGVIGLATSRLFSQTASAAYTATIKPTGGLSGGGRQALSFNGAAE